MEMRCCNIQHGPAASEVGASGHETTADASCMSQLLQVEVVGVRAVYLAVLLLSKSVGVRH